MPQQHGLLVSHRVQRVNTSFLLFHPPQQPVESRTHNLKPSRTRSVQLSTAAHTASRGSNSTINKPRELLRYLASTLPSNPTFLVVTLAQ